MTPNSLPPTWACHLYTTIHSPIDLFAHAEFAALKQHIITEARRMGFARLSLETGSAEFFAPARRLYEKFGFEYCEPFADYRPDPNSVFLTRTL